ncbi:MULTISPECIES: rhomboid family intramembrane serine protease [Treponema]|jgi:membrane associated rhomboid family serine protease|uniref:Membrane associated rhomboid family serine protease n=1 Tax=Treponema rectale TaxID=744512 RepID=A0A840SH75_9SPIR|nr:MULTISPECIES: rhomboid family intramembrane serine protease [Treponema]MBB5218771.1 membrane associated rhomboid family serine protease [Treponema rectale]MBE6353250.1 rhomboid family intramembrane serine protease [Treponema sp.]
MFLRKPFKYTFSNVTLYLIGINVIVYLAGTLGLRFIVKGIPFDITHIFSANYIIMRIFNFYWQPFTYMFVHANITHLVFNMIGLLCFGYAVEKAIGSREFLLFYIFCGTLDGIISIIVYANTGLQYVWLMGASGAIYAVLFAYAVIFPRNRIFIWGIIPVPAPLLVLGYAVIEFLSQFNFRAGDNVAHLTHLVGFILAWLYLLVRMGVHPIRIWKDAYFR